MKRGAAVLTPADEETEARKRQATTLKVQVTPAPQGRDGQTNGFHPTAPLAEIPGLELPTGWLDCPKMGGSFREWGLYIVPMKVPLASKFDRVVPGHCRFTPEDVVEDMSRRGTPIGLVIDLTNSMRYYKPEDWTKLGVDYHKIRCRGHGQVPSPENVNEFMWEAANWDPRSGKYIAVHCTHGFNRTGYMIVSLLVRKGLSVADAVKVFAKVRSPGIYKDDYLEKIFLYNHEREPLGFRGPGVPQWKEGEPDSPVRDGIPSEAEAQGTDWDHMIGAEGDELKHDDILGEAVPPQLEEQLQVMVMQLVLNLAPDHHPDRPVFPGSQPVSLSRDNLDLLDKRRYWVTWKADGTRYLLLITTMGTYLIDRSFNVRRVQMRFPLPDRAQPPAKPGRPRQIALHTQTLLDGEMVVDEDVSTGKFTRRYLAYDLITVNGRRYNDRPFKTRKQMIEAVRAGQQERFQLLQEWVMNPRAKEKDRIEREFIEESKPRPPGEKPHRFNYPIRYEYAKEPFRVRRKDFYPLYMTPHLLERLMPDLSHETDGLILQGYEDAYVPQTCHELLKWKFAHLNSVDFLLKVDKGQPELWLNETRRDRDRRGHVRLQDAKVVFPDEETMLVNNKKIVECSWDEGAQQWIYMRTRIDKDSPNAYHVYEKVKKSIDDKILEDELLARMDEAMRLQPYTKDMQVKAQAAAASVAAAAH